jgi:hypothetical protein
MSIVLELDLKIPLIDPVRFLVKLTNKTGVSEKIKRSATDYLKQVTDSNISAGKDPMSIAATILYLTCLHYDDLSKTQRYFAEVAGISDVTIRNRRQELQDKIPSMISRKWQIRMVPGLYLLGPLLNYYLESFYIRLCVLVHSNHVGVAVYSC